MLRLRRNGHLGESRSPGRRQHRFKQFVPGLLVRLDDQASLRVFRVQPLDMSAHRRRVNPPFVDPDLPFSLIATSTLTVGF